MLKAVPVALFILCKTIAAINGTFDNVYLRRGLQQRWIEMVFS